MPSKSGPRNEFTYVLRYEKWTPTLTGSIKDLIVNGEIVPKENYEEGLGRSQQYFCPRCGYPCLLSPHSGEPSRDGKPAIFKHFPQENPRKCKFRSGKSEGNLYLSEEEKLKAIEDGQLTIVKAWLSKVSEGNLNVDSPSIYGGVTEDENGPLSDQPIGRYRKDSRGVPRQISTLQFIVDHLPDFYAYDFQLPDADQPEAFSDIFVHTSQAFEFSDRGRSAIYWGRVERIFRDGDMLCIAFGYEKYSIYFEVLEQHVIDRGYSFTELVDKVIAVSSELRPSPRFQFMEAEQYPGLGRKCMEVVTKDWGAFGVFRREIETFLPNSDRHEWVAPSIIPDNYSPISKRDTTRSRQRRSRVFDRFNGIFWNKLFPGNG